MQYVALPDTQLDDSSLHRSAASSKAASRTSSRCGTTHTGRCGSSPEYHGLVDGPAQLESLTPTASPSQVTGTGSVTVHIHDSPHWAVHGAGCTSISADGWTKLEHLHPGSVRC